MLQYLTLAQAPTPSPGSPPGAKARDASPAPKPGRDPAVATTLDKSLETPAIQPQAAAIKPEATTSLGKTPGTPALPRQKEASISTGEFFFLVVIMIFLTLIGPFLHKAIAYLYGSFINRLYPAPIAPVEVIRAQRVLEPVPEAKPPDPELMTLIDRVDRLEKNLTKEHDRIRSESNTYVRTEELAREIEKIRTPISQAQKSAPENTQTWQERQEKQALQTRVNSLEKSVNDNTESIRILTNNTSNNGIDDVQRKLQEAVSRIDRLQVDYNGLMALEGKLLGKVQSALEAKAAEIERRFEDIQKKVHVEMTQIKFSAFAVDVQNLRDSLPDGSGHPLPAEIVSQWRAAWEKARQLVSIDEQDMTFDPAVVGQILDLAVMNPADPGLLNYLHKAKSMRNAWDAILHTVDHQSQVAELAALFNQRVVAPFLGKAEQIQQYQETVKRMLVTCQDSGSESIIVPRAEHALDQAVLHFCKASNEAEFYFQPLGIEICKLYDVLRTLETKEPATQVLRWLNAHHIYYDREMASQFEAGPARFDMLPRMIQRLVEEQVKASRGGLEDKSQWVIAGLSQNLWFRFQPGAEAREELLPPIFILQSN